MVARTQQQAGRTARMTESLELRTAAAIALAFAGLQLVGAFAPTPLTWGWDALAFLPWWMATLYALLAAGAVLYAWRAPIGQLLGPAAAAMEERRRAVLLAAACVLTLLSLYLRVRAPLLGDSFYLIRNFVEAFRGIAPLYPRNEPLATYYFSLVLGLRDITTYQKFLDGFLLADILLGLGFMVNVALLVRWSIEGAVPRLLAFLFLLALPYVQLFLGYIEVYAVVLYALSIYALALAAYFRRMIPFAALAGVFVVVAMVHYINILLAGSLLYAGLLEYRRRNWKALGAAAAVAAAMLLMTSFFIGFDYGKFSSWVPHSHFLSILEPTDPAERYAQAYTLFSPYHLVDLGNLFMLLGLPSAAIMGLAVWRLRGTLRDLPFVAALAAGFIPVMLFSLVVKFDLGAARDWDVFAPYLFLFALAASAAFWHRREFDGTRAFACIAACALVTSFAYFLVNARAEPGVARYMSLLDRRTMSQNNYYGAMLQLSMYYHETGDAARPVGLWEEYNRLFPEDPRGYANIVNNLLRIGPGEHGRILGTFERWRALDPSQAGMQQRYLDYCLDAGKAFYESGDAAAAADCYRHLIAVAPDHPKGYNNLGSVLAQQAKYDSAVDMFRRAVALDSTYTEAYYNLGTALGDAGYPAEGVDALRQAARLGSPQAQEALQQKGLVW
jgi:tetratricopeptide (TPR) repeat protein